MSRARARRCLGDGVTSSGRHPVDKNAGGDDSCGGGVERSAIRPIGYGQCCQQGRLWVWWGREREILVAAPSSRLSFKAFIAAHSRLWKCEACDVRHSSEQKRCHLQDLHWSNCAGREGEERFHEGRWCFARRRNVAPEAGRVHMAWPRRHAPHLIVVTFSSEAEVANTLVGMPLWGAKVGQLSQHHLTLLERSGCKHASARPLLRRVRRGAATERRH